MILIFIVLTNDEPWWKVKLSPTCGSSVYLQGKIILQKVAAIENRCSQFNYLIKKKLTDIPPSLNSYIRPLHICSLSATMWHIYSCGIAMSIDNYVSRG